MSLTLLAPVFLLGGIVFLHEAGHFFVAKWMGLPVETFSIGMGPRLVGFKWNETDVRISLLPLGGYVKLAGYNPEEPQAEDTHGFHAQPYWKKMFFYSGGILANLATTLVLLAILGVHNSRVVQRIPQSSPLLVIQVVAGGAAEAAGLQAGDQIIRLDSLNFPGSDDQSAVQYIKSQANKVVSIEVNRQGKPFIFNATPENVSGNGRLGIQFQPIQFQEVLRPLEGKDLAQGLFFATGTLRDITKQIFSFLGQAVQFNISRDQVAGPIGIIQQSTQAAKFGWQTLVFLAAAISLQLGILNALPIPMLDGGHMLVLTIEQMMGREIDWKIKKQILAGGFILLLTLMVSVVFIDVGRLFR